jgi:diguanylate cyclase (GGDEF)-like protein/PAS domain S-box-containing protein
VTEPQPLTPANVDRALDALLRREPRPLVAAVADDGHQIPFPDVPGFEDFPRLPVPEIRGTMLDLVVPADHLAVITAWDRVRRQGLAHANVRLLSEPDRRVLMMFVDARRHHGFWIGALLDEAEDSGAVELGATVAVARRPKTATVTKNMFAVMTDADDRTTRMLGWSREQLVGVRTLEFIHPDDHERAIANWMELLSNQQSQRVRVRHRCADGSLLWVEFENTYHHSEVAEEITVTTQIVDISDEMAAHEAVLQREQLFRRLAESLPAGLFQVGVDRSLVYANSRLAAVLGVSGAATLADQLATVDEADRERARSAFDDVLDGDADDVTLEIGVRLPAGGELRRCLLTIAALSDAEGAPGAIVTVTDVTDRARMSEELRIRATYDELTGCHNRASTMAVLEELGGAGTAVVFVDLDRFKPVNDELGHAAGDALLAEFGGRLRALLRDDDVVGRIGGDEFLLVCRGVADPDEALAIATRVRDALAGRLRLAGTDVPLRCSIGVALWEPGLDADGLVARADAAMYESKRDGAGRPVLATGSLPGLSA